MFTETGKKKNIVPESGWGWGGVVGNVEYHLRNLLYRNCIFFSPGRWAKQRAHAVKNNVITSTLDSQMEWA